MKLSKNTLVILNNFAAISNNMQFYEGKTQKTFHPSQTILAVADLDVDIPRDFGIWDLKQFLGAMSLFDDPNLEFEERLVRITQDKQKVNYNIINFKDLNMQVLPKEKKYELSNIVETIDISKELFDKIRNTAALFKQDFLAFEAKDGFLKIKTFDGENIEKCSSEFEIAETSNEFSLILKVANLEMLSLDYVVKLSSDKKILFEAKNFPIFYIVVCEKNSIT